MADEKKEDVKLHTHFDAAVWAKEFMRIFGNKLTEIDEDLMHTWFANAIMCGWDHSNYNQYRCITREELLQAFGLAYIAPKNSHKVLDEDVAFALTDNIFEKY